MSSKEDKERHVTGHTGTTIWEVQSIMIVLILGYLCNKLVWFNTRKQSVWFVYAMEYLMIICPIVLSLTAPQYIFTIISVQMGLIFTLFLGKQDTTKEQVSKRNHESFIVAMRAGLQILTICAILAVDFHVFPRRFAKTEIFGTSPMDVGVGGFVFSSGLVAGPRILNPKTTGWKSFLTTIRLVFPALLLGLSRAFLTTAVDYQKHVTEYGVHWNFFITLGLIPVLLNIQQSILPRAPLILVGGAILGLYQYGLFSGIQEYIMTAPRVDLVSMNREGIFSMLGFYGIFLIAGQIGSELLLIQDIEKKRSSQHRTLLKYLIFFSGCLFACYQLDWQISRRMANLPFAVWVSWVGVTFLYGLFLIDGYLVVLNYTPLSFQSINRNQLAVFLVANLMTGGINLSIDTLSYSDGYARLVIFGYMFLAGFVAVIWNQYDITIKL